MGTPASIIDPISIPVPSTYTPGTTDISPPSISISKSIVDVNKNGQLEEGEKLNITYGAIDEDGVESIKLSIDGELIEMRNKEGAYSATINPLSAGNHSIMIEAVDSKGNNKLEEIKFTVERTGPSVYFPKLRYEVNVGEDVNIVLSAVNPIGNPKMEALLILKPPNNGVSIYESDCKGLAGMCTGKFEIEPGDGIRPVSVRMRADRPREYPIGAEIYYRFDGGQRSPTLYENLILVVKPALTSPSIQNEAQKPSIPGFSVLISIIALSLLIILLKKKA